MRACASDRARRASGHTGTGAWAPAASWTGTGPGQVEDRRDDRHGCGRDCHPCPVLPADGEQGQGQRGGGPWAGRAMNPGLARKARSTRLTLSPVRPQLPVAGGLTKPLSLPSRLSARQAPPGQPAKRMSYHGVEQRKKKGHRGGASYGIEPGPPPGIKAQPGTTGLQSQCRHSGRAFPGAPLSVSLPLSRAISRLPRATVAESDEADTVAATRSGSGAIEASGLPRNRGRRPRGRGPGRRSACPRSWPSHGWPRFRSGSVACGRSHGAPAGQ